MDLSSDKLTTISNSIWNLTNLNSLQLNNNQLIILPDGITNLINLKNLWLNNVQLKTLPSNITNLTNLNELDLENNSSLGNLSNDFDYNSDSKTDKILDTNWDWKADANLTIKWNWDVVVFSKDLNDNNFTDNNFVKCLKDSNNVSDKNWHNVQLTFTWKSGQWKLTSSNNTISKVTRLDCDSLEISNIQGISKFTNLT